MSIQVPELSWLLIHWIQVFDSEVKQPGSKFKYLPLYSADVKNGSGHYLSTGTVQLL